MDATAKALGRLIVLGVAFTLAATAIVITSWRPGTGWPLIPFTAAVALIARVIYIETKEQP